MPDGTGQDMAHASAAPDSFVDVITRTLLGGADEFFANAEISVGQAASPSTRHQANPNARAQRLAHGQIQSLGGYWAGLSACRRARATDRWRFRR